MSGETAVIIGGGPAGLTAAYELAARSRIKPVVLEMSDSVGGLSKTVDHGGYLIDAGGHRFVSGSERVLGWWKNIMPVESATVSRERDDRVLLARHRVSRIFHLKKFFGYPVSLDLEFMLKLGVKRAAGILSSYARARLFPTKPEKNLEDFFVNRFGRELYAQFFRDYSNKLWGVPCSMIKPEWGSQRIRKPTLRGTLKDTLRKTYGKAAEKSSPDVFLYPKYGPGQMWSEVSKTIREKGGEIRLNHRVVGVNGRGSGVTGVVVEDRLTGETTTESADYYLSSMPVRDLIGSWKGGVPSDAADAAGSLEYRSLITVALVLKRLKVKAVDGGLIRDNWVYVQDKDVRLGRIQVYNNWSPYLVKDKNRVLLGLEYFCNEGDGLWLMDDSRLVELAVEETAKIGFIEKESVLDSAVVRRGKAYPAYYGGYGRMDAIRDFTDRYENLFLIGRNGTHSYNNMDVSMLTAMAAVDNIINGVKDKSNIWAVNKEYAYTGD